MRVPLLSGLITGCVLWASALPAVADGLPPGCLIGDTFTVTANRGVGSSLIGQGTEAGAKLWTGYGQTVVTAEGDVTVTDDAGAMGLLELVKPSEAMNLSADLKPGGTGFVGIALLPSDSPSDFWTTAAAWVLLNANGDYEIYAHGTTTRLKKGPGADYAFKDGDFNHVELFCEPASGKVSVKINGKVVLPATAVADLPALECAAFRFNDKSTPNGPRVDNFSVSPAAVAAAW